MSQCVFSENKDGLNKLFRFDDEMVDDTYKFDSLMMSRTDFDIKVIEIPNVQRVDEHDLLRYKIRGLYPGTPEETVFDYQIVNVKKERYAVLFITKKDVLKRYKEISQKKPLLLPYIIVSPVIKTSTEKDCLVIFLHTSWTEMLEFRRGILKSSIVLKMSRDDILNDYKTFQEFLPQIQDNQKLMFFCSSAKINRLQEVIGNCDCVRDPYDVLSIEEQLDNLRMKSGFLFAEKRRETFLPQKARLAILVFLILVLSGFWVYKFVYDREQYRNRLVGQMSSLEERYNRIAALKKDTEELEIVLSVLEEQQPVDVYIALSCIFEVLGDETLVTYFTFDNGSFQFEAVGSDALVLIQKFNSHHDFSDIKILQITLDKGSDIERFRITGNVNIN